MISSSQQLICYNSYEMERYSVLFTPHNVRTCTLENDLLIMFTVAIQCLSVTCGIHTDFDLMALNRIIKGSSSPSYYCCYSYYSIYYYPLFSDFLITNNCHRTRLDIFIFFAGCAGCMLQYCQDGVHAHDLIAWVR